MGEDRNPTIDFLEPNDQIMGQIFGALEGFAMRVETIDGEVIRGIVVGANPTSGNLILKNDPHSAVTSLVPLKLVEKVRVL